MNSKDIKEIAIDAAGRLCIWPTNEKFTMIYRSATEVHWDNNGDFLYSPMPREWSYLDWYKHIVSTIATEYKSKLMVTSSTKWTNIDEELKKSILSVKVI